MQKLFDDLALTTNAAWSNLCRSEAPSAYGLVRIWTRDEGGCRVEVVILDDESAVARVAADVVARHVRESARPNVGVATGATPMRLYRELQLRGTTNDLDVGNVTFFLLDEYVGLTSDHPASYHRFIHEHLTDALGIDRAAVRGPDGAAEDLVAEAARFESALARAGGIDLQVLGLGTDGHIGFNEPGSSLASRTRVKTLNEQTRTDNARYFAGGSVPVHAITQGVGTILEARHLLLLVTGEAKAGAAAQALEGPVTAMVPGSAIQMHPRVTVLVDEEAATALTLAGYHRSAYVAKPSWQQL